MSTPPGSGAIPSRKPNPKINNSKNPKNVHHIAGIPVEFPYKPYGTQLSFMHRVISTLDRAQKYGHCHALLESPTGTGKSLSLLCSTLAWQQNYKINNIKAILSQSIPAPEATTDPLGHGGGFIPETQHASIPTSSVSEPRDSGNSKNKKKLAPTIYYASRTHSQISQMVREYRKTSYRVPMAILASRKHYCTNPHVSKENIDEECKLLLSNREEGCSEFKNTHKVKCHPSLQKGGCHEAHDIEDLVKIGQVVKGCAYYAARSMADDAQLVFCPYSYIINPVIRGAMDVDIKGAIIILDEAHNIEDITREGGSVDLEEDDLLKLQMELNQLKTINADIYQPLYEMTLNLLSWIEQTKSKLEETNDSKHYFSSWTGDKALRQLQEANISQQFFLSLLEFATKAIKAASDTESDVLHLSGKSVITLEGLFSSLTYFFSRDGSHICDYQLALQRYLKKDEKNAFGSWTCSLGLWCLNPSIVFRDVADISLSVILTSGTLSPMNSFSSELGVQFGNYLEAPHVIDIKSQVWSAIISHGPDNCRLDASYKTADQYAFQDALGKSLEEIFKIAPGGCLIFFPSYKLMEKLCDRWRNTGQWSLLKARKPIFVEPRGGNQEEFESVLKSYYDLVSRGKKPFLRRKRRTKRTDDNVGEPAEVTNHGGAAFFAVFRGKVSEGIDFSDDNARVVIAVGIPFPNINDKQVALKKKYNNTYRSSKNLLSGNDWYCQQAFRSLNQALGRCIRHRYDYGAIILLDWRFQDEKNRAYISKWLRPSIRMYGSFEKSLDELRSFFSEVKELVAKNKQLSSLAKYDITSEMKPQSDVAAQTKMQTDKDEKTCNECIYLECNSPKDSRCFEASSMTFSSEDQDVIMVQGTPSVNTCISLPSPGSLTKDGSCCSTIIQKSTKSPNQFLFHPMSTSLNEVPSVCGSETRFTPAKDADQNTAGAIPTKESPLNPSVCSYIQKRRKSMASTFISLVDEEGSDTPQIPGSMNFVGLANGDMRRRIEFGFDTSTAENGFPKESTVPQPLATDDTILSCPVMDKRLQISCILCRSPLGRPENHLYLSLSLTVSSKLYLLSLFKERLVSCDSNTPPTVPVIITDMSSVDPRLCNGTLEGDREQGTWCEEDGCVFKKVFCPFCISPNNCLGVQIKAADEKNVQLLNKIMLYHGSVVIRNSEAAEDQAAKDKVNGSSTKKTAALNSIDKYAYSPKQSDFGGWRTTKSKLKLSKR